MRRLRVPLFKSTGGGAVVHREASEEGEEVVCVFGCDDCFDIVRDFGPAYNGSGWWSVAGGSNDHFLFLSLSSEGLALFKTLT